MGSFMLSTGRPARNPGRPVVPHEAACYLCLFPVLSSGLCLPGAVSFRQKRHHLQHAANVPPRYDHLKRYLRTVQSCVAAGHMREPKALAESGQTSPRADANESGHGPKSAFPREGTKCTAFAFLLLVCGQVFMGRRVLRRSLPVLRMCKLPTLRRRAPSISFFSFSCFCRKTWPAIPQAVSPVQFKGKIKFSLSEWHLLLHPLAANNAFQLRLTPAGPRSAALRPNMAVAIRANVAHL